MHWTFQEYLKQPRWFIDRLIEQVNEEYMQARQQARSARKR